jgi:hypothetical protein
MMNAKSKQRRTRQTLNWKTKLKMNLAAVALAAAQNLVIGGLQLED